MMGVMVEVGEWVKREEKEEEKEEEEEGEQVARREEPPPTATGELFTSTSGRGSPARKGGCDLA